MIGFMAKPAQMVAYYALMLRADITEENMIPEKQLFTAVAGVF